MNLAQALDRDRSGRISLERASAPESLPPRLRAPDDPKVRTHSMPSNAVRKTARASARPRGLRPAARRLVYLVGRRGSASLEEIVAVVRADGDAVSSRRLIAVRVTNLHLRGHLRRTGLRGRYRYAAAK